MSVIHSSISSSLGNLTHAFLALQVAGLPTPLVSPLPNSKERPTLEGFFQTLQLLLDEGDAGPRVLNRARLTPESPLLPYRALVCRLELGVAGRGLLAVIRRHNQRPFTEEDAKDLASSIALGSAPAALSQAWPARSTLSDLGEAVHQRRLAAAETTSITVAYIDVDQLHALNELEGFAVGDAAIGAVSALLERQQTPDILTSRLAGDRYAAVLFGRTLNHARTWAERLCTGIARLSIGPPNKSVTASLGIAPLQPLETFERALAQAETACRAAKDRGSNRVEVYEPGDLSIVRRYEHVRDSRDFIQALNSGRLELFAQPIVDLRQPQSRMTEFEILVRIRNESGVAESPQEYLQALGRYQLLLQLDSWVFEHTMQVLSTHRLALSGCHFALNVSGQSLSDPDFANLVCAALARNPHAAAAISFEFTETAALKNLDATQRFIRRASELGCRFALDDFGTGVSSLMHLKELAVDRIKIDGRFTRDILQNTRSDALVRALVQIAGTLQLDTVAEYVETPGVAAYLKRIGVGFAQGYLFGRPRELTRLCTSGAQDSAASEARELTTAVKMRARPADRIR